MSPFCSTLPLKFKFHGVIKPAISFCFYNGAMLQNCLLSQILPILKDKNYIRKSTPEIRFQNHLKRFVCYVGDTFDINDIIIGMTVLAIGGSLPDMLNSIFVARDGKTSKVPSFFHIETRKLYRRLHMINSSAFECEVH